jgi:hypothetical protein
MEKKTRKDYAPTCVIMEGGVPGNTSIIQDTNKFLKAIKVIHERKGCAVQGLLVGKRKGHRGDETRPQTKRGGTRSKLTSGEMDRLTENMWMHPDAEAAHSKVR